MNINEAFPSNYIKAADLQGGSPTVTISHVTSEEIGDDCKLVLYFQGKEKGMVLNKTNANNIGSLYGAETDDWHGKKVTLAVAWVDFQGRSVEAIRVRPPASAGRAPAKQDAPPAHDRIPEDMNDSVPF